MHRILVKVIELVMDTPPCEIAVRHICIPCLMLDAVAVVPAGSLHKVPRHVDVKLYPTVYHLRLYVYQVLPKRKKMTAEPTLSSEKAEQHVYRR